MAKLTQQQIEVVRDYISNYPEMEPYDVGNYFGRVADLDQDTVGRIATVAMMMKNGEDSDEQLAPFIEETSSA